MSSVSICIVTFNSVNDIEACLNSVLRLSHSIETIVIVDNGSTDGSVDVVKVWNDKVNLIRNSVNKGFAAAQNQAIAETDSDYVVILNPDVQLDPDYVSEILVVMENDPSIGSATGQLVLAEYPDKMDSAGLGIKWNRQVFDLAAGEPVFSWEQPGEVFGVSGAAAVYRNAMIREISYNGEFFDETFFAYKEDVDVAWRSRHLGWKAWYVPSAKALHSRGWKKGGRKSIPLFVRRHSYQNHFYLLIKNEPAGWHWFTLLPLLLLTEVLKLAYIVLKEPNLLVSWATILKKTPEMMKKRRWLLNKRKNNR